MCNVRESLANIGVCHCAARHENSRANITISHVLLTDRSPKDQVEEIAKSQTRESSSRQTEIAEGMPPVDDQRPRTSAAQRGLHVSYVAPVVGSTFRGR